MEFERTEQEFKEYMQGLALREDPDNGSYEHALMIEEFQKSEHSRLNEVFKDEYKNYIKNETYFYGCPFDIYSRTYNQRLESYITCLKEEYNFIDYKTAETVFIEQELKEIYPFNPYLFLNEDLKAIIKKSLEDRNTFLNDKLSTIRNKQSTIKNGKTPDYIQVGSLFAQGFIKVKTGKFNFKGRDFSSYNDFSVALSKEIDNIKKVRQYIQATINGTGEKNIYKSKIKMQKIIEFCIEKEINISDEFQSIYDTLNK